MPLPDCRVCTAFTLIGWRTADLEVLPEGRAVTRWPMIALREAMVCIVIGVIGEKRVSRRACAGGFCPLRWHIILFFYFSHAVWIADRVGFGREKRSDWATELNLHREFSHNGHFPGSKKPQRLRGN